MHNVPLSAFLRKTSEDSPKFEGNSWTAPVLKRESAKTKKQPDACNHTGINHLHFYHYNYLLIIKEIQKTCLHLIEAMSLFKCTSWKEGCELLRAVCTGRVVTVCVCVFRNGVKTTCII